MIEILILIAFSKTLARIAESKGRSKAWAGLGALGWIGGELVGGVIGAIASDGDGVGAIYAIALLGAAIGAGTAYFIVKSLPDQNAAPESQGARAEAAQGAVNPNYDPSNPYSPPRVDR